MQKTLGGILVFVAVAAVVAFAVHGCDGAGHTTTPAGIPAEQRSGQLPTGTVVNSDTSQLVSPLPLWKQISANSSSYTNGGQNERVTYHAKGGDTHLTANGEPQQNHAFRRFSIEDGDHYGNDPASRERTQIGANSSDETFASFGEGERYVTYMSFRLPGGRERKTAAWSEHPPQLWQMKYTESVDNGQPPALAMAQTPHGVRLNSHYDDKKAKLWSHRVPLNRWIRFAFDVVYSQDAAHAYIQVWADFRGSGHLVPQSRVITGYPTLSPDSPSALWVGIYQDSSVPGHYVDVDNVQVVKVAH